MWGLVYVDVCVAFKVVVMNGPILGGLFQVYRWALQNTSASISILE